MLGLPSKTEYNKRIPKQKFYENLSVTPALKRIFVEQIQSVIWANKIAPATINISAGKEVTEIEVFRIVLNSDSLDESALRQMDKQIPYHILFVLEYNERYQIWIGYKEQSTGDNAFKVNKYYHTDWLDEQSAKVKIEGFDTDNVYENLVRQIGGIESSTENSLGEQIADKERREKLEKEIAKLEKLARAEKQPKRKFEIVQQKKLLEKEYALLTSNVHSSVAMVENVESDIDKTEKQKPINTVKALSILPEYADDILAGVKTIEWRSWKTDYRGDLLICSSSRKLKGYISGYALCVVKLVDVVPFTRKHVSGALMDGVPNPAGYAWILEDVRYIEPFRYKGQLHIYDVDASQVKILASIDTQEGDKVYEKYYKPLYIEAGAEF